MNLILKFLKLPSNLQKLNMMADPSLHMQDSSISKCVVTRCTRPLSPIVLSLTITS